jgi:hypothetical protein
MTIPLQHKIDLRVGQLIRNILTGENEIIIRTDGEMEKITGEYYDSKNRY